MSDIVEKLRVPCFEIGLDEAWIDAQRKDAAAEIERLQAQVAALRNGFAPSGYVLVPREPTNAMLKAAAKSMSPEKRPTKKWVSCSEKHAIRYRAMIAASLTTGGDDE